MRQSIPRKMFVFLVLPVEKHNINNHYLSGLSKAKQTSNTLSDMYESYIAFDKYT